MQCEKVFKHVSIDFSDPTYNSYPFASGLVLKTSICIYCNATYKKTINIYNLIGLNMR